VKRPELHVLLPISPQHSCGIREGSHRVFTINSYEVALDLGLGLWQGFSCHGNDGISEPSFQKYTRAEAANDARDSLRKVNRTAGMASDYVGSGAGPWVFVT
jgi:hypothetical protein